MVDVIIGKSPEHHELSSVVQPRNLRTLLASQAIGGSD